MPPLYCWIIFAACIRFVQTANETLVHGWVSEPNGRGTWSILWSCLATIFLCTWSAMHLDVPECHDSWYLFFQKLRWMLVAIMAPELILYSTVLRLFNARKVSRYLIQKGYREWTLQQTLFALAKGFRARTSNGQLLAIDSSYFHPADVKIRFVDFIKNDDDSLKVPSISEDELNSRGKSDWITKIIALLQITWFIVQSVARVTQNYQVTVLEITTAAYVACSIFTYGACWYQPQNVEYPVILKSQDYSQNTEMITSSSQFLDDSRSEMQATRKDSFRRRTHVLTLSELSMASSFHKLGILFVLSACG